MVLIRFSIPSLSLFPCSIILSNFLSLIIKRELFHFCASTINSTFALRLYSLYTTSISALPLHLSGVILRNLILLPPLTATVQFMLDSIFTLSGNTSVSPTNNLILPSFAAIPSILPSMSVLNTKVEGVITNDTGLFPSLPSSPLAAMSLFSYFFVVLFQTYQKPSLPIYGVPADVVFIFSATYSSSVFPLLTLNSPLNLLPLALITFILCFSKSKLLISAYCTIEGATTVLSKKPVL